MKYNFLNTLDKKSLVELENIILNNQQEIIYEIEKRKINSENHESKLNYETPIEELNIDFDLIQKLKQDGINNLEDFKKININKYALKGTTSWEQLRWAQLFYDYSELEMLPNNLTELEQAKIFCKHK